MKNAGRFISIAIILLVSALLIGADVSPTSDFYVNDYANVLSEETEAHIMEYSVPLAEKTGAQIVVLTVNDLGGKTPEEYGLSVGRDWGIGDAEKDNGLLILLAVSERKVRIEVGRGLEGVLNDAKTARLTRDYAVDDYSNDDFDKGTLELYDALLSVVRSEYGEEALAGYEDALKEDEDVTFTDIVYTILFFAIFIGLPLFIVNLIKKLIEKRRRRLGLPVSSRSSGSDYSYSSSYSDYSSSSSSYSGGGGSFGGGGSTSSF